MIQPLEEMVVLDLSSGIPGAYATKLLADGGAEVIKAEAPEGDALRRRSASGAEIPHGEDGVLFRFLGCGKRSVVADPDSAADVDLVEGMARRAEAIVWSEGSRLASLGLFAPQSLRGLAPRASILSISPFGLDGPWTGRAATEMTLQGWCGGPGQRGSVERPPVVAGGRLGEWVAGMVGAAAVLASRYRSSRCGVGELLDLSMLEALVYTQAMHPVTYFAMAGRPWRPVRVANLPDIHRTRDGYVGFMLVTGQQWLDFCAMLGREDWLSEATLGVFDKRALRRDVILPVIDAWMAERSTAEVIELASALRIPVAEVGNGATVPHFDHFEECGFYVKNPRGGFLQPARPWRFSAEGEPPDVPPAPRLGEHTANYRNRPPRDRPTEPPPSLSSPERPFEGLRVADFTAFWAGPSAGHFLAMLGADVIHVESPTRPDGMRANSVRSPGDEDWWEWSPFFQGTNTNKRSIALDLGVDRGLELARKLISECDVVLDNFSPRVMERWNLGYEEIRLLRPDVIMVRMPAFGLTGPWRDRTGYAQTMEQVSGMAWITGYPDQSPQIPNGPCDPIGGSHATVALLLALEHRRRTGEGMLVEAPMVGGALNVAAEQVIEHSANGRLLERQGNRDPEAAVQNLHLSADVDADGRRDRWVAISIETDEQWRALREAMDRPDWATKRGLETFAGRRATHEEIDRELALWCATRTSDEIVETLWNAGVPVAKVMLPHEQAELEPLRTRGFFETLEHPVSGPVPFAGYPVRFSAGPGKLQRTPAPRLGEHNREVFGGLLGISSSELDELERDGVIADRRT